MSRNPFATLSADSTKSVGALSLQGNETAGTVSTGIRPPGLQSYVCGRRDTELAFVTIPHLLEQTCNRYGSGTAAVFPAQNISLSWQQLRERADKLAAGLLSLGIRRGNRVAIWSPNRVEWLIAQFGTARIGAILVNINPAYQSHELEYALTKVRARMLIMARRQKSSDYLSILKKVAPELDHSQATTTSSELYLHAMPSLKHIVVLAEGEIPNGCISWDTLLQLAGPAHYQRLDTLTAQLDPDDAINIQFTSGTTGSPKGATLSHYNIVNNARSTAKAMLLSTNDSVCIPVPLYHCFGMVLGVLACASVGASMVFPGETFDAGATLESVNHYRCTALYGVPTMFITMLEHERFNDIDITCLRTGIMAGASCPVDTMQRVMNDMHMHEVTIAYGMTETSPVSFQSATDDPLDKRVATVGRIQPHVEAKVIDKSGSIVAPGVTGELCTRGYLVMLGYWGMQSTDAENPVDAAGWMHTGDLAVLDTDGYCSITGRVKDMVIRGGENIYPREVEEFLLGHPAVQDVQVFGIPDERLGEALCAWIILRKPDAIDAERILHYCSGSIAHFKIPSHIRFVKEFPMTVTGKPQKYAMRDAMVEQLALPVGKR
ncbi:MAG: AMP-binding protein [Granulosicoccus sp.]